jgi:hypothetical protein
MPMFEIRVKSELAPRWSEWFDGFALTSGDGETVLTGEVADQPALWGVLGKVRNLGLELISVQQLSRMA